VRRGLVDRRPAAASPLVRNTEAVSWAQSSNTQSGEAVASHGASCDGLKPTSTSPDVALPGTRPRGASEDPLAAPPGTAWMVFPPVRCHALFMLHRALLI
jgi:hypothetical protein